MEMSNLLIYSDFKKDLKQNYFLEFHIVSGQPSETFNLPPANSTCDGQVGNCLFLTLYWSCASGGLA